MKVQLFAELADEEDNDFELTAGRLKMFTESLGWSEGAVEKSGDDFITYAVMDLEIPDGKWSYSAIRRAYKHSNGDLNIVGIKSDDKLLYPSKLTTDDSQIELTKLSFGSLWSNTFSNHFHIPCVGATEVERREKSDLRFSAEYDRSQIVIHYCAENTRINSKFNKAGKNITKKMTAYTVTIPLNSICRLIFEPTSKEVYFGLRYPPMVRIGNCDKKDEILTMNYMRAFYIKDPITSNGCGEECLVDSDVIRISLDMNSKKMHGILARLCSLTTIPVETRRLQEKYLPRQYEEGSIYNPDFRSHFAAKGSKLGFLGNNPTFLQLKDEIHSKSDRECIEYLTEALLTRGSVVRNQLLLDDQWSTFVTVLKCVNTNLGVEALAEALKSVIFRVDECKPIRSIMRSIIRLAQKNLRSGQNAFKERDGYIEIRRVIITPTRVLPMVPDVIKGNRVLRKYGAENMFRAAFRDDNGEMIRGPKVVHDKVKQYMKKGIFLQANLYGYLGSSTSQMRDGGAYYHVAITEDDLAADKLSPSTQFYSIERIHNELGSFEKLVYIEKYMARLGQCFTQSQAARHHLQQEYKEYHTEVTGGNNNGSPYIFSDGCGSISMQLAESLAKELGIPDSVPSTFQFRLGGYKGVLCVNPQLDQLNLFLSELPTKPGEIYEPVHVALRHSQDKFHTENEDGHALEIVKISGVTTVSLNKPLIMILDQESKHQSLACHIRITTHIEELLNDHLMKLARMLLEEKDFFATLVDLPNNFGIRDLSDVHFRFIDEPFFRSQVRAVVIYGIVKQFTKLQISIPSNLGRCMFGVIDETGLLQSGQIFVQYTNSTRGYTPPSNATTTIVTGNVLVTKSPSVVCGDVRVFNSVNIPELNHLVDVIVFPQHGPRPHSDEMAGSDLDGDEYMIIWDKELLLDKNAPAANYKKKTAKTKPIKVEQLNNEMCEYFVNYLSGDSVGTISNAHLFQADLRGINSAVCKEIAKKVNEAVDFPKSGIAPKQLTNNWSKDARGRPFPPERLEMNPDYHNNNSHRPSYISHRLIGRLYRALKDVEEAVRSSVTQQQKQKVEVDPQFLMKSHPEWKKYEEIAKRDMLAYNNSITNLMSVYGVKSEGELFSGYITEFSRGYNACEDNTMFNTERAVKERLTTILRQFREQFFGKTETEWLSNTVSINDRNPDQPDILKRRINNSKDHLLCKASAYYSVCYETAAQSLNPLLSFPWIVADVLAEIRKFHVFQNKEVVLEHQSRLHKVLGEQVHFCWNTKFDSKFKLKFVRVLRKIAYFNHYFTVYPDLAVLSIILYRWWDLVRTTHDIRSEHISILLIRFAYSNTDSKSINSTYIEKYDPTDATPKKSVELKNYLELLIRFIEYLASRKFKNQDRISFVQDGLNSVFIKNEWHHLHKAALKCFYNLIFSMKIKEFTVCENTGPNELEAEIYECEPFVINVSESVDIDHIARTVCDKLIVNVEFRRFDPKKKRLVSVMAKGTAHSLQELRTMLAVVPEKQTNYASKEQFEKLVASAPVYST